MTNFKQFLLEQTDNSVKLLSQLKNDINSPKTIGVAGSDHSRADCVKLAQSISPNTKSTVNSLGGYVSMETAEDKSKLLQKIDELQSKAASGTGEITVTARKFRGFLIYTIISTHEYMNSGHTVSSDSHYIVVQS